MDMEKTPQYSWPLSKLGQGTRNKVLPLCSFMCVPLDSMMLFIFNWLVNRLLFHNIFLLLFVSQKKGLHENMCSPNLQHKNEFIWKSPSKTQWYAGLLAHVNSIIANLPESLSGIIAITNIHSGGSAQVFHLFPS